MEKFVLRHHRVGLKVHDRSVSKEQQHETHEESDGQEDAEALGEPTIGLRKGALGDDQDAAEESAEDRQSQQLQPGDEEGLPGTLPEVAAHEGAGDEGEDTHAGEALTDLDGLIPAREGEIRETETLILGALTA